MAKAKSSTTKDKTKRPAAAKAVKPEAVAIDDAPKVTHASAASTKKTRSGMASELVLGSLVAELFGTFVLTAALLNLSLIHI